MAKKSAEKKAPDKKSGKYKKRKGNETLVKRDKYHKLVQPKLKLVSACKLRDMSDEDIAQLLGIAYSTFKVYKAKYPELSAALSAGAREGVLYVEGSLHGRSIGMKETRKVHIKVKEIIYDERTGRKQKEIERIEYATEEVFIPPETNAAKFYLLNRAPELWREHREPVRDETTGGIVFIPKRNDEG